MYPARANFTSGAGGEAWWLWIYPGDPAALYQSQWPTIVRRVQETLKSILTDAGDGYEYIRFTDIGTCGSGNAITMFPQRMAPGTRRPADITIDGQWGGETADILGFFLCKLGLDYAASQLTRDIATRTISTATLRHMLWIASFVSPADVNLEERTIRPATLAALTMIKLQGNETMPRWPINPPVDPRDRDFFLGVELNSGNEVTYVPNPPSIGGARPVYAPAALSKGVASDVIAGTEATAGALMDQRGSTAQFIMLGVLAAAGYWFLMRDEK